MPPSPSQIPDDRCIRDLIPDLCLGKHTPVQLGKRWLLTPHGDFTLQESCLAHTLPSLRVPLRQATRITNRSQFTSTMDPTIAHKHHHLRYRNVSGTLEPSHEEPSPEYRTTHLPPPQLNATTQLRERSASGMCHHHRREFQTIGASGIRSQTCALASTRPSSWAKGGC